MNKKLMDVIACPVCKGNLKLSVKEEDETEIIEGSLCCSQCNVNYAIVESIPILLPVKRNNKSGETTPKGNKQKEASNGDIH